ncbi:MAG: hypothetical protein F6J95_023585 [Leptolyngbya sp. SIO1E4]|nr:hypothetical protein [Leptolyngbya sp. SIO1E4]
MSNREAYDYRFLRSGELEFRSRGGRYRIISGCSVLGIFEFEERLEEIRAIAREAPDSLSVGELYRQDERFRYLCDRILTLNGIDLDWITPREMSWLIFSRIEGDRIVEAPLQTLNKPPKPRHPSGDSKGGLTDRVALIAAIATHCNGNLDLAYEIAASRPAAEMLAVMEELCWLRKSPKQRREAEFKDWGKGERKKLRAMRGAINRNSGEK